MDIYWLITKKLTYVLLNVLEEIFRVIPSFVNSLIIKQSLVNSKYYSLNYIKANYKYLTFELISIPKIEEIAYLTSMCPELVIEHYSGRN